ncbi:hypothetical protein SAMN05518849_101535 [Sphingobium sp. AP50]|uniref:DUF6950 family protein n=1 Tax=Sphingobium sp. AP50 TaxID=1884369 RepID=UPI0008D76DC9|nr:hypothetical protein [Sphingobium sp. AP50]SEI67998.1 hypothetical protein SAMN05518849_101535 [Sphingobium sp. AP50]
MNLSDRRDATRQTMERFVGPAFAWGEHDCGVMVISHLRLFGYAIEEGGWSTPLGLQRWLSRNGGSGPAFLDGLIGNRIAPAQRIVGDIVEMPAPLSFLGAFGIAMPNSRVLAYYEGAESAAIIQPSSFLAAWRP